VREQNKNFTETMLAFRASATHISNAVDSARIAALIDTIRVTSGNAARLVANIDSTNRRASRLLDAANNPNGTLGKLLGDSLLYSDARHTMASLDSLLADFKANPRKYINLSIFGRK
jgi:phospholipid/cholesterol/gamma-HCH transport system substrate-binding protein